jgi:ParB family chromosome partitioning protein
MTSGIFEAFPLSAIWVDRATRQRRELNGIPELADSIKRVGLINPPVVRRSGELVAGERRWEALKSLGWTHAPVQIAEDMDPHEFRSIELEENIRRLALPWQDECKAVEEYHQLRKQSDPKWTDLKTGEALGMTMAAIGQKRAVAQELIKGNKRVVEAPKYSTARGIIQRDGERRAAAVKESLNGAPKQESPILNVDFHKWQPTYADSIFNFIHCDFPYGINIDKADMGPAGGSFSQGTYDDSFDTYSALLDRLHLAMENVIAESAHLMFWFSLDYYEYTASRLEYMGWKVDPFPLIWFKSDNTGICPDPSRGPRRIYETCFFARRGDRKVVQSIGNCFPCAVPINSHMSEKPLPMLRHFMRMIVDEYTRALDPTAGSGNAIIAAKLGGGQVCGLEINPEFADRAAANYRSHTSGTAENSR